jgi:hypothetical protein
MVPTENHEVFTGAITVVGAPVGLHFVATRPLEPWLRRRLPKLRSDADVR